MTDDRPAADDRLANDDGTPANGGGRRPWPERLGLGAIAVVMAALFAAVAIAAGTNGELILAAMSGVGAFMTAAVGLNTVIRG